MMSVQREIEFDYVAFENLLFELTQDAFNAIQEEHSGEHFYVFGLYGGGKFLNMHISANTEERLLEYAKDAQDVHAKKISLPLSEAMIHLRYNESWNYGIETRERFSGHFAPIHDLLRERDKQIVQMRYHNRHHVTLEENQAITAAQVERMRDLFVVVLKRLDAEHVFEKTNSRADVVVAQHYLPLCLAESPSIEELNPSDVVQKVRAELTLLREIDSRIKKAGSWWVPKDRRPWDKGK